MTQIEEQGKSSVRIIKDNDLRHTQFYLPVSGKLTQIRYRSFSHVPVLDEIQ